jgi:hypothetical protein
MIRLLHLLLTLTLAGMLGSCADHGPTTPVVNGAVELRQGETAHVRNPDLYLTFDHVIAESRCPMGAMCIISGEVVVQMIGREGSRVVSFQLHLTTMEGASDSTAPPVTALGHRFRLFRLDPYPQISQPRLAIRPLATVVVD